MWKIGKIEIEGKVVLGPMAGITSLAYRDFMKSFGVAYSVTEMVSDYGITYQNAQTLEYLQTSKDDHPIALQLFGGSAEIIVKAIKISATTEPNFDFYDINLGCPVPKVTSNGAGSILLKNPLSLYAYMKEIVSGADKPVTAKIRLGWDDSSINFMENIKALEKAGVSAICIHARTAKQGYSGKARYELLRDIRSKMDVPLIISGDIYTLDDAINALNITGADAVMVARGGVGNPNLVKQIDHYFKTGERLPDISLKDNVTNLLKYTDLLIAEKGEHRAMLILRGVAPRFFSNYANCKKIKNAIAQSLDSKADLIRILQEFGLC